MENMSFEILEAIRDTYNDGTEDSNELIAKCAYFLYHTCNDETLRHDCVEIMNDTHYCLSCGNKMIFYEWEEVRPIGVEMMGTYDCPICNESGVHY